MCIQKNVSTEKHNWFCCSEACWTNFLASCECHYSLRQNSSEIIFYVSLMKINMFHLNIIYRACFVHLQENMIREFNTKYVASATNLEVLSNHCRKKMFAGQILKESLHLFILCCYRFSYHFLLARFGKQNTVHTVNGSEFCKRKQ